MFTKIDNQTIVEVKEVETRYDISHIRNMIANFDNQITMLQEQKAKFVAILGEAQKLGVEPIKGPLEIIKQGDINAG